MEHLNDFLGDTWQYNSEAEKDMIAGFWIACQRFESAIKMAGYVSAFKQKKTGDVIVVADWMGYAAQIDDFFDLNANPKVNQATLYFDQQSFHKQTKQDGQLAFEPAFVVDKPATQYLQLVRMARDNMFHGGKFAAVKVEDTSRNFRLFEQGMVIVDYAVSLDSRVRQNFER